MKENSNKIKQKSSSKFFLPVDSETLSFFKKLKEEVKRREKINITYNKAVMMAVEYLKDKKVTIESLMKHLVKGGSNKNE